MDKFDRQLLNDEIDMLKGNINRMCVTTNADELWQMESYALIRLTNIAKMCDLRMKELKEEETEKKYYCGKANDEYCHLYNNGTVQDKCFKEDCLCICEENNND